MRHQHLLAVKPRDAHPNLNAAGRVDLELVHGRRLALKEPAPSIFWLQKRPVARPPHEVRRVWKKPRRVVAKVEWHSGELYPRAGFIVTSLTRPAERVAAVYNQRGTAERHIKEGKNA